MLFFFMLGTFCPPFLETLMGVFVCSGLPVVTSQGAQALAQIFCLNLLNEAGRTAVSSVIRQRGTLYPPATDPLKDICSNYSSLRGCDKWLLGSIVLLVFRCVLHDATSLVIGGSGKTLLALPFQP